MVVPPALFFLLKIPLATWSLLCFCMNFRGFIPGINLTKEVENLYGGIVKTLEKETKGGTRRWHELSCSWVGVGRINIVGKNDLITKSNQ